MASKHAALRRRIRSGTLASRACAVVDCPKSTIGRGDEEISILQY
jgi:hypothetical protein